MSGSERVPIQPLTSRTGTAWLAGTVVLVAGVLGYLAATQPQQRVPVAVVGLVVVIAVLGLLSRRTWIEPASGTVVRETFWCWRRRAELPSATAVALVDNRGGGMLLRISDERTVQLPVLLLSDYVQRSQPPRVLRLLADQVDRHVPNGGRVAEQLHRQADFIAAGGPAVQSPLASLVSYAVVRAAKAGGAGGLLG
jgi:hypothetical protein